MLTNLPWHFGEQLALYDLGDVVCDDRDLESAQEKLSALVGDAISRGYLPIVLGGGHSVAWANYRGATWALGRERSWPAILNFDAHYDIRLPEPAPTSGTSFYQIARLCQENGQTFRYTCAGLQPTGNSLALITRANEMTIWPIPVHQLSPVLEPEGRDAIFQLVDEADRLYLTICLDVFDAAFAPGVSAPATGGLSPAVVLPLLTEIASSGKLITIDIAELNPSLDLDNRTARLAAHLVFYLLSGYNQVARTGTSRS